MSIEEQIQAAASQNAHLLGILSETDYAPPALEQHKRYIADLQTESQTLDKRLKTLETSRLKELKDHEKYRDSVMKRFAYKVGGKKDKFEARAGKEEREYFEALQEEHRAKEARKDLSSRLDEALAARTNLEQVATTHGNAQRDLDALYDSIFQGPTPGFPEEDERERAAHDALQRYHDLRSRAEGEGQAVKLLADASQKMRFAIIAMSNAKDYSRMDMFGGGTMSDMMERSELSKSAVLISQVETQVAQAQRMSPDVWGIPAVHVPQGNIMSDVFFDNIFTDMAFHDKIKAAMVEIERAAGALQQQFEGAKGRHAAMLRDLGGFARTLEESRLALQKAREYAFERVAGR